MGCLVGVGRVGEQQSNAIEITAGRMPAAEARLTKALARFPDQSAIRVQLAHVVDTRGRGEESRELIKGLFDRSGFGASARYRYAQWPVSALAAMRAELDESVQAHLGELQSLLSPKTPAGGR